MAVALTTQTLFAQVPSYVPTNGLVGYWPFNGNANDLSGNGNSGTVNGATLTTDRFGNSDRAYSFDGVNDFIQTSFNGITGSSSRTIALWYYTNNFGPSQTLLSYGLDDIPSNYINLWTSSTCTGIGLDISYSYKDYSNSVSLGQWNHYILVIDNLNGTTLNDAKIYKNGVLINTLCNSMGLNTQINTLQQFSMTFGKYHAQSIDYLNGKLDDIGVWNRALTQQEITNLYNANQCITNITVTDTLVINVGQLSFNDPVTWANNITIAPNPASTQININFNNITDLNGGTLKVINSLGQEVATTPITTSGTNSTMQLATWGSTGMYFVQIINPQGQIVDIKKIILQ